MGQFVTSWLNDLIDRLGGFSPLVLMAVLIVVVGVWAFIALADEVREGDTQRFDEWAVRILRQPNDPAELRGPHWLHEVARDVTAMGGVTFLLLTTLAVAGYFLMVRKYHGMILVLVATIGGLLISTLLKDIIARQRPSVVPHLSDVYT